MLNERTRQFCNAIHCKVTRQLKTEARMGLKQRLFGTKTEQVQTKSVVVWYPMF